MLGSFWAKLPPKISQILGVMLAWPACLPKKCVNGVVEGAHLWFKTTKQTCMCIPSMDVFEMHNAKKCAYGVVRRTYIPLMPPNVYVAT